MTPRLGMAMTIAGVVLVVGGLVGGFVTGGDEDEVAEPTEVTGPTETPEPADEEGAPEETPEEFYGRLEAAFQGADVDFMIERLHPEVVDLYGEEQCRGFLADQPSRTIEVVEIGGTEPFDFGARDDVDLVVDDTLVVTIRQSIEGADAPVESESHIVRADDGTLRWFTDCGDPA